MRRGILILALFASGCLFTSSGVDEPGRDMGDGNDTGRDASTRDSEQGGDGAVEDTCGDGLLQPNETCDPMLPKDSPGSCPTTCDDDEACTLDELTGSPDECNVACRSTVIEVCANNDGCCPSACSAETDTDCDDTAVCGDGILAPAESCDPGITSGEGACPTIDDCPINTCAVPRVAGSRANCDAACVDIPIQSCTDGDGCCPSACASTNDDDCMAMCGNAIVDPGERCDGNCPMDCDDGNPCTDDTMEGTPGTCDVRCVNTPISACVDNDQCCPSTCNSGTDNDCSATCGNMAVDANETCDDSSPMTADACPTTCNDMDACTQDTSTGSAANCNRVCGNNPITACVSADGCCPDNGLCNATNDTDCMPECGNGAVEPGETCDGNCPTNCDDGLGCTVDSLVGSASDCSADCSNTPITACTGGDGCCANGCNNNNDSDCGPSCGNGVIEGAELCDGNCRQTCNDGDACTIDITMGTPMQCNRECSYNQITTCASNDGCCPSGCTSANDNDCVANCGNNVVDPGETCDGNCPTVISCAMMGACHALTGSASQCDAVCAPTPGCQTCTLGGNCPCSADQACIGGRCVDSDGGNQCTQACDGADYCEDYSNGSLCEPQTGFCVECLNNLDCAYDESCSAGYCGYADFCNEAANPTLYCNDLGYPACNMQTGDCWDACQSPDDCGETETCVGGFCLEAMSCGEASDQDAWCSNYDPGLICIDDQCQNACTLINQNCDCPDPVQQSCVGHSSGKNYCSGPPPQNCQQVCIGFRNEYCEDRLPGSMCGVPTQQNPDGCYLVPMDPDPDMGPDMGPPDMGFDMNLPDFGGMNDLAFPD